MTQVLYQGTARFMEVKFFFRVIVAGVPETVALGSMYSVANEHIRQDTHGALNVFDHRGEEGLVVIPVTSILSVIAMVPFGERAEGSFARFFLCEKFALGVIDTGITTD